MLVVKLLTWICYVAVISFPLNFQSGVSLEAAKSRTVTHTLKGTDTFRTFSYSWITKSSNSSGPQMLCQFVSVFFLMNSKPRCVLYPLQRLKRSIFAILILTNQCNRCPVPILKQISTPFGSFPVYCSRILFPGTNTLVR